MTGSVASRRFRHRGPRLVRELIVIVVVALLLSFLVKTFLVRSFYIPSGSMENTLLVNDRVVVNALIPDVVPLARGDVIVFSDPGGWLGPPMAAGRSALEEALTVVGFAPSGDGEHLIKRVVGLPGDTVECCNAHGQLSVNGMPIDEPYALVPEGTVRVSFDDFTVTVPDDSLWVMGDNRYNSNDSRYNQDQPGHGFVEMDAVVGRAFLVSWPLDRWGWLGGGEAFSGVENAEGAEGAGRR